jgi:hypothetical protein
MTETSADWVERPKPADVAALTTRPAPTPSRSRERSVQKAAQELDPRVMAALTAAVTVAAALLLRQRRHR